LLLSIYKTWSYKWIDASTVHRFHLNTAFIEMLS